MFLREQGEAWSKGGAGPHQLGENSQEQREERKQVETLKAGKVEGQVAVAGKEGGQSD